jgi:hypothetical protein
MGNVLSECCSHPSQGVENKQRNSKTTPTSTPSFLFHSSTLAFKIWTIFGIFQSQTLKESKSNQSEGLQLMNWKLGTSPTAITFHQTMSKQTMFYFMKMETVGTMATKSTLTLTMNQKIWNRTRVACQQEQFVESQHLFTLANLSRTFTYDLRCFG